MEKECHVCARVYTMFRWRPGKDARYKMTVLCQTCARLKNVCQCCIYDLEHGLPTQVRDAFVKPADELVIPKSHVNREFFAMQHEKELLDNPDGPIPRGTASMIPQQLRDARFKPYYDRNRAKVCSFFVKGACNRGASCPYRHERPVDNELSQQNMKDRYYGVNDPVAKKMLTKYEERVAAKNEGQAVQQQRALETPGASASSGFLYPSQSPY
jgi:pre-mRNA-splicing factor RBM22/SLT11